MPPTIHIVGAGLAGLSSAVGLVGRGCPVRVYEAAGHAGGRCRSFHDATLDREIDNGNHLLLSGNRAVFDYLEAVGVRDGLVGPDRAEIPFLDLATDLRWTVRPGVGPIPWWILRRRRRVPGTSIGEYLAVRKLIRAGPGVTVAECLCPDGPLFRRFWEPMAVAVLNADATEGAAILLGAVMRETFARGAKACRPLVARQGLSRCLVRPALAWLAGRGASVRFNARLRGIHFRGERATALDFGRDRIDLGSDDGLILAVPPQAASILVPGIVVPTASRAIVNGHFRLPRSLSGPTILGLLGGTCQWVFVRGDIASVTISAADHLIDEASEDMAPRLWHDVVRALELGSAPLPPYRIVKERRATFAQTPDEIGRRPGVRTRWRNLCLAGDWIDTGLPATVEGAIRSGRRAADALLGLKNRA